MGILFVYHLSVLAILQHRIFVCARISCPARSWQQRRKQRWRYRREGIGLAPSTGIVRDKELSIDHARRLRQALLASHVSSFAGKNRAKQASLQQLSSLIRETEDRRETRQYWQTWMTIQGGGLTESRPGSFSAASHIAILASISCLSFSTFSFLRLSNSSAVARFAWDPRREHADMCTLAHLCTWR